MEVIALLTDAVHGIETSELGKPTTRQYFNALGQTVNTQKESYTATNLKTKATYDFEGKPLNMYGPYSGTTENLTNSKTYDANQLLQVNNTHNFANASTKLTTNILNQGTNTTVTDPASRTTSATINPIYKVNSTIDAQNNITNYVYNSTGKVKEYTFVNKNQKVENNWDDFGRKTAYKDPQSFTAQGITYAYDAESKLTKMTHPGKTAINYTSYDKLGRLLEKQYSNTDKCTYSYVAQGSAGAGNMQSMAHSNTAANSVNSSVTFGYDALSRLETTTKVIGDKSFITRATYDTYGNAAGTEYPSGLKIWNEYDSKGFIVKIRKDSPTGDILWQLTTMNEREQITDYTYANAKTAKIDYDGWGHIAKKWYNSDAFWIESDFNTNATSGNLYKRKFSFGVEEQFGYTTKDELNSILPIAGTLPLPATESITYDYLGRMNTRTNYGTYSYNTGRPNLLVTIVPPALAARPALSTQTQTITYTPFSKAETITENGMTATIYYGADEQRVKMTIKNAANTIGYHIFYNGDYELVTSLDGTKTLERHYIWAPTGLLGVYIITNAAATPPSGAGGLFYAFTDHLGSILRLVDAAGTELLSQGFDAWGRKRNPTGLDYNFTPPSGVGGLPLLTRGFTFHEHLDEFNLINMNGRLYDPYLGQFLSADPLAEKYVNMSPYVYAANNPLRYTDMTGMYIDDDSKEEWEKYKNDLNDEIENLGNKVSKITSKAQNKNWSSNRLNRKLGFYNSRLSYLNNTKNTLSNLEKSSQKYSLSKAAINENGETYFNSDKKSIEFKVNSRQTFIHEITHGQQFEDKRLGFSTTSKGSFAKDILDEVEAYQAQYAATNELFRNKDNVTIDWIRGIKNENGNSIYDIDSEIPLNMDSNRDLIIRAYPAQKHLFINYPQDVTFKNFENSIWKY